MFLKFIVLFVAGFYLNATEEKWKNWRMYDYVVSELPALLAASFGNVLDVSNASIFGHSMGGHGALTIALKNPDKYKSVSAFAPICNPIAVPWGQKAFKGYLGSDEATWKEYDTCELLQKHTGRKVPMLVDTGSGDKFLPEQLKPETLESVCAATKYPATIRMQDGYDHSYFFISTYVSEHIEFHAKSL